MNAGDFNLPTEYMNLETTAMLKNTNLFSKPFQCDNTSR